jgi:hypothetical protein
MCSLFLCTSSRGDNSFDKCVPPGGEFVQISASGVYSCGLRPDGSISCWGDTGPTGRGEPPPNTRFNSIFCGPLHSCGITTDLDVVCWGGNGYSKGKRSPPQGKFLQVAVGSFHTCGITVSGSIACWGTLPGGISPPAAVLGCAAGAGDGLGSSLLYDPVSRICIASCQAGSQKHEDGRFCAPCKRGRYSVGSDATECIGCDAGSSNGFIGSAECFDCVPGTLGGTW